MKWLRLSGPVEAAQLRWPSSGGSGEVVRAMGAAALPTPHPPTHDIVTNARHRHQRMASHETTDLHHMRAACPWSFRVAASAIHPTSASKIPMATTLTPAHASNIRMSTSSDAIRHADIHSNTPRARPSHHHALRTTTHCTTTYGTPPPVEHHDARRATTQSTPRRAARHDARHAMTCGIPTRAHPPHRTSPRAAHHKPLRSTQPHPPRATQPASRHRNPSSAVTES
ncbi:hypothetical protein ATK36_3262 [Amycolatopsis sulphurea]|uniref:Uncharacterized protein n=1 Tax=Amycolatopsis sulphurea TaxID=76022 RepID=A0A2A9F9T4_9PSEU|nr:hypothetical protein ATK36_3262 [Amycolatopsis sulphurea]